MTYYLLTYLLSSMQVVEPVSFHDQVCIDCHKADSLVLLLAYFLKLNLNLICILSVVC